MSELDSQKKIDDYAQKVLDMFGGENSAVCVLSMLSVIECITVNEKASAAFRKQSADLLDDQSFRIRSSLRLENTA